MIDASVRVNFKDTKQYIDNLNDRQLPFVAALTLTRLAQGSQKQLQAEMGRFFTLRSKRRLQRGIRIKAAKKADFKRGNMHSLVMDIDRFMALHTAGGIKKPERHRFISIPTDELLERGARTTTGAMKKRWRPKTLIAQTKQERRQTKRGRHRKPRPFVMEVRGGQPMIAERVGHEKHPVIFLFGLDPKATIKKTWPFVETVYRHVFKNSGRVFNKEYRRIIGS